MKKLLTFTLSLFILGQIFGQTTFLVPYRLGDLYGFSDTLGNIKIKPQYKEVLKSVFFNGEDSTIVKARMLVRDSSGLKIIDHQNKVLLSTAFGYDTVFFFRGNPDFFGMKRNGLSGVFANGKEIIPCEYLKIKPAENLSFIVDKGLSGLFNSKGEKIIPVAFDYIIEDYNKEENDSMYYWYARINNKREYFSDIRVKSLKEANDEVSPIRVVVSDEQVESRTNLNQLGYDKVENIGQGYYKVESKGKTGIYDNRLKKEVIALAERSIEEYFIFKDELYIIDKLKNGKFSCLKEGNIQIIAPVYNGIQHAAGSVLIVEDISGKMDIYNFENPGVLSFEYDMLQNTYGYDTTIYFIATKGDKKGLILQDKKVILPFEYEDIRERDNFLELTKNGKKGAYIFNTAYPPIACKYDEIEMFDAFRVSNRWFFCWFVTEIDGKLSFIGENGVEYFKR